MMWMSFRRPVSRNWLPLMAPLPGEWEVLRLVIDLIQANAKGAELGPVLETIERALRADRPGQDDRGGVSGTAGRSRTGPAAPADRGVRQPRPTLINEEMPQWLLG